MRHLGRWVSTFETAWQRITGNTQISLVYRSWWTLFFVWYIMIFLIYSSLLGLLFFFFTGAQSSQAAALVTIGEIYSMNGKKDEARKAPRVHRVPWGCTMAFPKPTNGYWMRSPWITPKRLSTSHWSCDFSVLSWHGNIYNIYIYVYNICVYIICMVCSNLYQTSLASSLTSLWTSLRRSEILRVKMLHCAGAQKNVRKRNCSMKLLEETILYYIICLYFCNPTECTLPRSEKHSWVAGTLCKRWNGSAWYASL